MTIEKYSFIKQASNIKPKDILMVKTTDSGVMLVEYVGETLVKDYPAMSARIMDTPCAEKIGNITDIQKLVIKKSIIRIIFERFID